MGSKWIQAFVATVLRPSQNRGHTRRDVRLKGLPRRRPSPALVIACIALFVALGPAAYAAHEVINSSDVVDNSLLSVDIKNEELTGADIKGSAALGVNGTILGEDIANSSLGSADFGTGSVTASDLATSAVTNAKIAANAVDASKIANDASGADNVNATRLDGIDSSGFLRNLAPLNLVGSVAGSGVIAADNSGSGNGLQGRTNSLSASGVYGENNGGGGFGIAGRAGSTGRAVYGDNTGTGYAGYFEDKVLVNGNLDVTGGGQVACAGCMGTEDLSSVARNEFRNHVYHSSAQPNVQITPNGGAAPGSVGSITVPAGLFLVSSTATFSNSASFAGQDNSRQVRCGVNWTGGLGNATIDVNVDGSFHSGSVSGTKVMSLGGGTLSLNCRAQTGGSDQSFVTVTYVEISALKLDDLN
jgi:hypothetical protein